MSQQQQQRQMMDAYDDATKLVAGQSHLTIPEGFKAFEIASNGISYLDFLPYVATTNPKVAPGAWTWFRSYNVHRNMGLDGRTSVVCPRDLGQPCPICEAASRLSRTYGTANKDIEKAIKALEAKQRTLFVVYDLDHPDDGIQIFDVSHYLFTKLLGNRIAKASPNDQFEQGWRYFADPENGMSLKITWAEDGFEGRKFWKCSSIDFRPRAQQYDAQGIVDMAPNLDDCLTVLPYEEIAALLAATPNDLLAHNADTPMANPPIASTGALPPRRLPTKAATAPAAAAPAAKPPTARPAAKAAPRPAAAAPAPAPAPAEEDAAWDEADVPADDEAAVLEYTETEGEVYEDEIPFEEPAPEPPPAPAPRAAAKAAPRPPAAPAAPRPPAAPAAAAAPRAPAKAAPRPAAAPAAPAPAAKAPAKAAPRPPAAAAPAAAPRAPAKAAPRPAAAPAAPAADADFGWPE
jgi:hypothetical protein